MNDIEKKVNKNEHPVVKALGWLATVGCCLVLGWLAHQIAQTHQIAAAPPEMAQAPAPLVLTETVVTDALNPPAEYIGHVEAIQDVGLRAQIDGYIQQIHFEEGALINAGDPLFSIDPERYEARVAVRKAEIGQAQANLERAERYLKRLEASDVRAITQTDLDTARSDVAQGHAAVKQAQANLVLAEIDLKHTKIIAPIAGRVGRTVANVGDYVAPALGTLLRIVQFDPVRVSFPVPDRDYLHLVTTFMQEKGPEALRVRLRLATGEIATLAGEFDFADNEMSLHTATIATRVKFDNPAGLLVPGGYVTVLIDLVEPPKHPVVRQSALMTDGGGFFVFVVNTDDAPAGQGIARKCYVEPGIRWGQRVELANGLVAGDVVIIEGTGKVADGQMVQLADAQVAATSEQTATPEKDSL